MPDPQILEYATEQRRRWNLRQVVGYLVITTAVAVSLLLWAGITYRLLLYYGEYGGVPGMSHIADGAFPGYYREGAIGVLIAFAGGVILWRRKGGYITGIVILLNTSGGLTFYLMHRCLILVEYFEWIRMHGP